MHKRSESLWPPKSLPVIYSVIESRVSSRFKNRTELLSTLPCIRFQNLEIEAIAPSKAKETILIMCCLKASSFDNSSSPGSPSSQRRAKGAKVRVRILRRARGEEKGTEMELQNLKLYLENRLMIEENERLRRKALLLGEENRALLTELRKKLPNVHDD